MFIWVVPKDGLNGENRLRVVYARVNVNSPRTPGGSATESHTKQKYQSVLLQGVYIITPTPIPQSQAHHLVF